MLSRIIFSLPGVPYPDRSLGRQQGPSKIACCLLDQRAGLCKSLTGFLRFCAVFADPAGWSWRPAPTYAGFGTEQFVWQYYSGSEKMCKKKVSVSESVGLLIVTFSLFGLLFQVKGPLGTYDRIHGVWRDAAAGVIRS